MQNITKPILENNQNGFGLLNSILVFGLATLILFFETHYLIPYLSETTGYEPILFWFLVAGLGMFLPIIIFGYLILRSEKNLFSKNYLIKRLRLQHMTKTDWQWAIGGLLAIGILSGFFMEVIKIIEGTVNTHPPFMSFEPLTPDRYWILLVWFPYWLLNILGEEIVWRGVLLPRQEVLFGKWTWILQGLLWGVFHISFGIHLLITLLPILFILPYIVQKRKNSWIGIIIHAGLNGPSFIAIAFGLI